MTIISWESYVARVNETEPFGIGGVLFKYLNDNTLLDPITPQMLNDFRNAHKDGIFDDLLNEIENITGPTALNQNVKIGDDLLDIASFNPDMDLSQGFKASSFEITTKTGIQQIAFLHFARNLLIEDRTYISIISDGEDSFDWQPDNENAFHQFDESEDNFKILSEDGHQEYIFDSTFKLVTDERNAGSYNFVPAAVSGITHLNLDIKTWSLFGNTIGDESLMSARGWKISGGVAFAEGYIYPQFNPAPTEIISGTPNDDDITIPENNNFRVFGLGGDDTLISGPLDDALFGGPGFNTASFINSPSAVAVNLELEFAHNGNASWSNRHEYLFDISAVTGSNFGDILIGSDESNTINGTGGNDYIDGGAGYDTADYSDWTQPISVELNTDEDSDFLVRKGLNTSTADNLKGIELIRGTALLDVINIAPNDIGSIERQNDGALLLDLKNDGLSQQYRFEDFEYFAFTDSDNYYQPFSVYGVTYDGKDGYDTVDYANEGSGAGVTATATNTGTTVTNTFGNTDTLLNIERIVFTGKDDAITITAGVTGVYDGGADNDKFIVVQNSELDPIRLDPTTLILKGGDGIDTIEFAGNYINDMRPTSITNVINDEADLKAYLSDFENIDIDYTLVLPDITSNYTFKGGLLRPGYYFDPIYDYSFSDVSGDFDISILTDPDFNSSGKITFFRGVKVGIDINGVTHTGTVSSNGRVDLSQLERNLVGHYVGTNNGDTINIHHNDNGLKTNAAGVLSFTLGKGNDIVNIDSGILGGRLNFGYKGGNDVINLAVDPILNFSDPLLDINVDATIKISDVSVTTTRADDKLSIEKLSTITLTTPKGTLSITGLNDRTPSIFFESGGSITFDTDGTHTINGATAGTFTVYGDYSDDFIVDSDYLQRTYFVLDGNDTVHTGKGNSIVHAGAGNDFINAGIGKDMLFGGEGNDTLIGGGGDDTLFGGSGSNTLQGGADNDTYYIGEGFDHITDNQGINHLFVQGFSPFALSYVNGTDFRITDLVKNKEIAIIDDISSFVDVTFDDGTVFTLDFLLGNITVTSFGTTGDDFIDQYASPVPVFIDLLEGNDEFIGSSHSDYILGGDGNDRIVGGDGNDWIEGGTGSDRIYGGDGDDILKSGFGNNHLEGGDGDDILYAMDWPTSLRGGQGNDLLISDSYSSYVRAEYTSSPAGVVVNLLEGMATEDGYGTQDQLQNIGGIDGSFHNDILTGNNARNVITGGDGNDVLSGLGGDDKLFGGGGDDTYVFAAGDGFDRITDTGGTDTLKLEGGLTLADLTFTKVGNDLVIDIASGGTIIDQFSEYFASGLEFLSFDDGSIVELSASLLQTNQPPIAQDDLFVTDENATFFGNVLADNGNGVDSDIEGDLLSVQAETIITGNGATVIIKEDGTFDYTPFANFYGTDSFNYTLLDGQDGSDVGNVSVTVEEAISEILGTPGRDNLLGTENNDVIRSLAGSFDRMTGAQGADVFVVGAEAINGVRERDIILDYEVGVDSILLEDGATVGSIRQTSSGVAVFLEGDFDAIYVQGDGVLVGNLTFVPEDIITA